jgi:uncharacterized protein
MGITFAPAKNARNIADRGLSFERVAELDWDVTPRGKDLHVISFRTASKQEVKRYGQKDAE